MSLSELMSLNSVPYDWEIGFFNWVKKQVDDLQSESLESLSLRGMNPETAIFFPFKNEWKAYIRDNRIIKSKLMFFLRTMSKPEKSVKFLHYHDNFDIWYVVKGTLEHTFDHGCVYQKADELLIITPGVIHSTVGLTEGTEAIRLCLLPQAVSANPLLAFGIEKKNQLLKDYFASALSGHPDSPSYQHFPSDHTLSVVRILSMLMRFWSQGYDDSTLLPLIASMFSVLSNPPDQPSNQEEAQKLIEYIKQNCAAITLSSLAEAYHYTPQYMSKYISEHTGRTFSAILRDIRIEKALELIEDGSTCSIAAKAVGYTYSRFFAACKAHLGMTPREAVLHKKEQSYL